MRLIQINLLAIIGLLWLASCSEDDKENDLEVQGSNTTLDVSGEVTGEYKAHGQYYEHYDDLTEMYVNSFEFLDNFNPSQSTFLISINRYADTPVNLGEHLHTVGNSYLVDGESERFGGGVTWWDSERKAIIYSEVENGFIRINRVTDSRVRGEFSLRMKTSEYNETQASLRIDGSFDVPRVEF